MKCKKLNAVLLTAAIAAVPSGPAAARTKAWLPQKIRIQTAYWN